MQYWYNGRQGRPEGQILIKMHDRLRRLKEYVQDLFEDTVRTPNEITNFYDRKITKRSEWSLNGLKTWSRASRNFKTVREPSNHSASQVI